MIKLDLDQKKIRINKEILMKVHMVFLRADKKILILSNRAIFRLKLTQGKGLKIWTQKQMLQILLIALAQVKAGNTSENSLNEICQIIQF